MIEKIEKFIRSNVYLYIVSRYLVGNFLYNFIYEKDFKFFLNSNYEFKNIIDIGGNDGISSRILRKFNKNSYILCIEPNKFYESILKKISIKDNRFKYIICGASNKKSFIKMYIPKYKKIYFRSLASINKNDFFNKNSFLPNVGLDYNKFKDVVLENFDVEIIKIDSLNMKPDLIKIDVEGHELEVVEGCSETINKSKSLIIIEINKNNFVNVVNFFKKKNYVLAIFNYNNNKLEYYKEIENFNLEDFFSWINEKGITVGNSFFHHNETNYQ